MARSYLLVSCDIIGHSAEADVRVQVARVRAINAMVRAVIERAKPASVFWASGGDGGHVGIGVDEPNCRGLAIGLIVEFRKWSEEKKVRLRISAHADDIEEIEGATGGVQPVGPGINLAGRLLDYGDQNRVVVSGAFREHFRPCDPVDVRFHSSKIVVPKYFALTTIFLLSVTRDFESSWHGIIEHENSTMHRSSNVC
jgi:hypothetical protein